MSGNSKLQITITNLNRHNISLDPFCYIDSNAYLMLILSIHKIRIYCCSANVQIIRYTQHLHFIIYRVILK